MNRAVFHADEPIPQDRLPPPRREPGGPLRVLFIANRTLGFKTSCGLRERYAGERPDIDAVHWYPGFSFADRLWAAPTPLSRWNLDLRISRQLQSARRSILRRVGQPGHLPLDRFDVVHVTTQQYGTFLPALRDRARARFVIEADATIPLYHRHFNQPRYLWGHANAMERDVFRACEAVACLSAWSRESIRDEMGVEGEKLFLFRPCPPAAGPADAASTRDPSGPLKIVFVGNDWLRKGGPRLIAWHQQRWVGKAEIHVCSGLAPADHTLKGVTWHGATPHAKLMGEILPSMHVLVMPTNVDTFVIAVAEAQISGLPVITSRLAGIQELVRDGETGWLCDRADDAAFIRAVETLIADVPLRRRMAQAARAHAVRNLDSRAWHDHLFDQFHRVAAGEHPRLAPPTVDPEALKPSPVAAVPPAAGASA